MENINNKASKTNENLSNQAVSGQGVNSQASNNRNVSNRAADNQSISNQIGSRIRKYRNQRGLTQETLALNSGINVSFLGDIERGTKKPSVESLEKLLKVLGVSFQEFFDFESDIKPFKDCTALERLNLKLKNRSEDEIEMVFDVARRILEFNDNIKNTRNTKSAKSTKNT